MPPEQNIEISPERGIEWQGPIPPNAQPGPVPETFTTMTITTPDGTRLMDLFQIGMYGQKHLFIDAEHVRVLGQACADFLITEATTQAEMLIVPGVDAVKQINDATIADIMSKRK